MQKVGKKQKKNCKRKASNAKTRKAQKNKNGIKMGKTKIENISLVKKIM